MKPSLPLQKGFSLIELLVSMALFIVVITMGIGALLVIINANAKAQNGQNAVSNIQFALDSMAREVRTGSAYYCSTGTGGNLAENTGDDSASNRRDCNRGQYLSFVEGGKSLTAVTSAANRRIAYCYNSSTQAVYRKIGSGSGNCGSGAWVRLTSPEVKITAFHFNVNGSATKVDSSDLWQPNVTIYVSGRVEGISDTSSEFELQTTVTKRVLDL